MASIHDDSTRFQPVPTPDADPTFLVCTDCGGPCPPEMKVCEACFAKDDAPTADLEEFTDAYLECALWSSTDDDGEPLDSDRDVSSIAPATLAEMKADCESFVRMFGAFIAADSARAGHDFWLTRNGHGAGFWDGDWADPYTPPTDDDWHAVKEAYATVGDYLTAMSKPYGEFNLYLGDDGLIHGG